MEDVDALIQMCCAAPSDRNRRLVLADKLGELGETECETAMRSRKGERIIRRVYEMADHLKRQPCLRLLWSVVVTGAAVKVEVREVEVPAPAPIPAPQPSVPRQRPWRIGDEYGRWEVRMVAVDKDRLLAGEG
jgi:hypothetical protein